MAARKRVNPLIIAVATALTVVIFLTDLSLPWGMAGGVPYVLLVLLGWWFQRRRDVYLLAGFASALTIAGYLLSPEGGPPWVALANRSLALLAIWGMAVLIARAKGAQEALQTSNEELGRRVKQRTRKLAEAIVERGRAQEAVREREQRLHLILDSLVVGVVTVDEMGVVQSFNPGAERIFGYGPDEVTGKNVSMLMPQPHRSRHDTYIANYLRTGEAKAVGRGREVEGRRKDGSIFPMELEIGEMMVGGRRMFAGIVKDITERKRAEEKLRQSEEFFRGVVETLQEGFALYDADDRLVLMNDEYRRLHPGAEDILQPGMPFEDLVRRNIELGINADAIGCEEEHIRERLEQHRDPKGPILRQFTNGTWFIIKESRTPDGGIVVTETDITELERAEDALRLSEERYRRLVETTNVIVWKMDISTWRFTYVSPPAVDILGYPLRDWYGENFWVDHIHPDDRAQAVEYCTSAAERGEDDAFEYRMIAADGGTVWFRDIVSVLSDADGPKALQGFMIDITERKRAEEQFRSYFDLRLVGSAIFAPDKRWIEVNDKLCDLFGYTRDELMRLTWVDLTHPDDLAENLRLFDRLLAGDGDDAYMVDKRFIRKNGEPLPASVSVQCVRRPDGAPDYFILLVQDLTERRHAEEALRESEERFRTMAANIPGNVYRRILHPDGRITWAHLSPGLRDLMELDPDAVMERPELLLDTLHPEDRALWHDALRKSAATLEPFILEYRRIRPSGTVVWLRSIARPHRRDNGDVVWDGVALDITEEKEAEARLVQASKLATLGEMASGIAHELNQPLSVVGMAAELSLMSMEEGEFDTEFVRKKLETIVGQKERMAAIVNHMRLFSRKDKAELESFDPLQSVSGAVRLIGKQFHASGIDLEEDLPVSSRHVSGHPAQLEQVVLNLLTNARDAVIGKMDDGGSGGRRIESKVRVSLVDDKRRKTVVISVADNGGGISEPALERVFDPFFTTKTEGHGTGLGLSISYSIIDSMGGRLEARNVNGGATFQISLPVSTVGLGAGEGRPGGKKPQSRTEEPDSDLPRILVVDDEEAVVAEVAEYLRRKGYDVVTAGNGREALKVHRARPADLVITDLLMPGMGGNELIQRLRRSDPDLPIVVVTGHTTFGDDRDVVAEGASVVLKKPIVLRELTDSLKGLDRR
ncbi:MAG: PAS domain S-box protein [Proteobacteria bacterium]|nr:PAS domain S-box protein [Pseudomonadota bacterium]